MTLLILAGVWALAFGHITIDSSLKMKGNDARLFGFVLILVAAFIMPHITAFLSGYTPGFITAHGTLHAAFDMLIGAAAVYGTGYTMQNLIPKLKLPVVTVSVKKARSSR